jgi:hypothetical protein
MRGLLEALESGDDARINRLCNSYIEHMDKATPLLFTPEEAEDVKDKILYIQLLSFMNLHNVAIDNAVEILHMCQKIRNVRMGVINRLNALDVAKHDKMFRMSLIDDLPSLVKYQIAECLKREYNMV